MFRKEEALVTYVTPAVTSLWPLWPSNIILMTNSLLGKSVLTTSSLIKECYILGNLSTWKYAKSFNKYNEHSMEIYGPRHVCW